MRIVYQSSSGVVVETPSKGSFIAIPKGSKVSEHKWFATQKGAVRFMEKNRTHTYVNCNPCSVN